MPGYKAPESKALHSFTSNLKERSGSDRDESTQLIESITKMVEKNPGFLAEHKLDGDKIILGSCVPELEKVQDFYSGTGMRVVSAIGNYTKLFKTESRLYNAMLKELNITDGNYLDDKQRLIYLNQYYQFAKTKQIKIREHDSKNTRLLADDIKLSINKLLTRLAPEIDAVTKQPPTGKSLLADFKSIPDTYATLSKDDYAFKAWIGYKDMHEKYAKFIKIMSDPFIAKYKLQQTNEGIQWPTSYTVPYATLLHIRNRISKEYIIRSAKNNSRLFNLCEDALNLQPGTKIPNDIQDIYLSDLRSLVSRLKADKDAVAYFEKQGFHSAKEFLTLMEHEIDVDLQELSKSEEPQSPTTAYIGSVLAFTAQFGIAVLSGHLAAQLLPGLTKKILSKGASVVGLIYYGEAGEALFKSVGSVVEDKLLNSVSTVLSTALDPLGSAIGYIASGAIAIAVQATQKGIRLITFNPKLLASKDEKVIDNEWLRTLRDVLPEDQKKLLMKTHDFDQDVTVAQNPLVEKLSALSSQVRMTKA